MRVMRMILVAAVAMYSTLAIAEAAEITCESRAHKRVECRVKEPSEVRLVKQLGNAPCTRGETWGITRHTVWVEDNCRAVFSTGDRGLRRERGTAP